MRSYTSIVVLIYGVKGAIRQYFAYHIGYVPIIVVMTIASPYFIAPSVKYIQRCIREAFVTIDKQVVVLPVTIWRKSFYPIARVFQWSNGNWNYFGYTNAIVQIA